MIDRPRLVASVEDALERHQVVCVQALAGFGTTTLAAEVARRWGGPTVWVSLDPADGDATRLWNLVAAAAAAAPIDDLSLDDARSSALNALEALDAVPLVILDDVHHLDVSALVGLMRTMERVRQSVRFVLTGRLRVKVPLDRLRAAGAVYELDPVELVFDRNELTELADHTGWEMERLSQLTAGWPALVRLLGSPGDRPACSLGRDLLADYLMSEVLGTLDTVTISLLLRASLFERWTAAMLASVVNRPVPEVAARLQRVAPALVPAGDEAGWLGLVPVLSELLGELRAQRLAPEEISDCRHAAARWLVANGFLDDAFEVQIAAGDHAAAARLLTAQTAKFEAERRQDLLRERFERLPRAVQMDPTVAAGYGWVALATSGARKALEWCARVENLHDLPEGVRRDLAVLKSFACRVAWRHDDAIHHGEEVVRSAAHPPVVDEAVQVAIAMAQQVEIGLWRGEFEMQRLRFDELRRVLDIRGARLSRAKHPAQRALAYARAGLVADAEYWVEEAHRAAEATGLLDTDVDAEKELARCLILIERDELEVAEALLEVVLERSSRGNFVTAHAAAVLDLAHLVLDHDPDRARRLVAELDERYPADEPYLAARKAVFAACHRARVGDTAALTATLAYYRSLGVDHAESGLRLARLMLDRDDSAAAGEFVPPDATCRKAGPRFEIVRSLLRSRLGESVDLPAVFNHAAQLGLAREVVLNAGSVDKLVAAGALQGVRPAYLHQLAEIGALWVPLPSVVVDLSERQLEILPLLASRATLREIAGQLFISENTLKTHLRNIYRKLGIASRREAAEFAEAHHLNGGIARSG